MHFAYPPRKSSNPAPFRPRASGIALPRRARLKTIALGLLVFIGLIYLIFSPGKKSPYHERQPSGSPHVVIVTVLDSRHYSKDYLSSVEDNRNTYAKRHGYKTFISPASNYDTKDAPASWSMLMAMRHALAKYPDCKYIWFLDQDAYIMDQRQSIDEVVMASSKLESLMIKDQPVVPPDSIIKTYGHLRGNDIDVVVAQDRTGLVHNNLIIRNGEWAKFFLETWMDPLYRSYNFQKAERHALEHLVQWHPTILSKLALVPQRTFASYTKATMGEVFQTGDFVAMFAGCAKVGQDSCENIAKEYREKWQAAFL